MSKISKLNELESQVQAEKIRIATETLAELEAGTFDISANEATRCLRITEADIEAQIVYEEECRSEALYGWDGLWTLVNDLKIGALYLDLAAVREALKKANEAFDAKIPF